MVKRIQPGGIQNVIPYLVVENAGKMIEFLAIVFDADVLECSDGREHKASNAILRIGETILEVSDSSNTFPGSLGMLHVYVPDADQVYQRALEAGAVSIREPVDEVFGERRAAVRDPFGGEWLISTPLV